MKSIWLLLNLPQIVACLAILQLGRILIKNDQLFEYMGLRASGSSGNMSDGEYAIYRSIKVLGYIIITSTLFYLCTLLYTSLYLI